MTHINTAAISGILIDKDPETKTMSSGSMVCRAFLHSARTERRGEKQWTQEAKIEISAWGKPGQTLSFLHIGDEVLVSGRLETREWSKDESKPPMRFQSISVDDLVVIKARAQSEASEPPHADPSLPW